MSDCSKETPKGVENLKLLVTDPEAQQNIQC